MKTRNVGKKGERDKGRERYMDGEREKERERDRDGNRGGNSDDEETRREQIRYRVEMLERETQELRR